MQLNSTKSKLYPPVINCIRCAILSSFFKISDGITIFKFQLFPLFVHYYGLFKCTFISSREQKKKNQYFLKFLSLKKKKPAFDIYKMLYINVIKCHRQLCFIFDLDSKHIVKLKILVCSILKSNQNVIFFFTVLLHPRNPNFGLCHIRIIILFFILWYQYHHNLILLVWFLKIPTAICYVLATIDQIPTSGAKNNLVIIK